MSEVGKRHSIIQISRWGEWPGQSVLRLARRLEPGQRVLTWHNNRKFEVTINANGFSFTVEDRTRSIRHYDQDGIRLPNIPISEDDRRRSTRLLYQELCDLSS